MKKYLIFLILIASLLRFWNISSVPISPDWDEVALAYNAKSILETGRDEYGKFLPFILRSFDDYKPALYAYLSIPSVAIFGLSVFSIRFPAAFFGVIGIVAFYFIVKELFPDYGIKVKNIKVGLAEVSGILLAVSPWHLQFSRIAFESNVGLTFNLLAALFFLKGLKNGKLLWISSFFGALSIYIYQSEKVFVPLLFIALITIYYKKFISLSKKWLVLFFGVGVVIGLPLIFNTIFDKTSLARAQGVSVFAEKNSLLSQNVLDLEADINNKDLVGLILDNRRFVYAHIIAANYITHFDFNWLFVKGDLSRHHAPEMGLFYIWQIPFLLLGLYLFVFYPFPIKSKLFVFSWLLIAPLPASITTGVPHAVRTLNLVPMLIILISGGILYLFLFLQKEYKNLVIPTFSVLSLIVVFNFAYYLNQYFVQQNYFNALDWQYGYEQAVPKVRNLEKNYSKIVVSNQPPMDQSYMFFLFYLNYPASKYQMETSGSSGGFREDHSFGKYEFRPIDWKNETKDGSILYVGRPGDFNGEKNLNTIYYPNGEPAIKIAK